jgi:hypothetical protein
MQPDNSSKSSSAPSSSPLRAPWRTWFVKRHTLYLESLLEMERENSREALIRQRQDFDAQTNLLRTRYESEVSYLRQRLQTVEDELERTRIYLTPAMKAVQTRLEEHAAEEKQSEQSGEETVTRKTAWQLTVEKERAADHAAYEEYKATHKPKTEAELFEAPI